MLNRRFSILIFSFIACCLLPTVNCFASHNRAGVITYKWVSGNTYKFTVETCTSIEPGVEADRPFIEILWGDGEKDTLYRENGPDDDSDGIPDGEEIIEDKVKYNLYTDTHTFPGPGIYTISFLDPNRNGGVINMPDSYNTPFYVESVLMIDPCIDPNNSPQLICKDDSAIACCDLETACVNQIYMFSPSVYDLDGDSLSYKLIACKEDIGVPITGYKFPGDVPPGSDFTINPVTGNVLWDTPKLIGEYNIAILIEEWRKDVCTGNTIKIGKITWDIQINVLDCANNPPEIEDLENICVEAGDTIYFTITATDPPYINPSDTTDTFPANEITLTASGEPFLLSISPAVFTPPLTPLTTVTGEFYWETACPHVRQQNYQVEFKAKDDNSQAELVDIETIQITIVGPAPKNPQVFPIGNSLQLSWDQSLCPEAIGYRVYRRNGFYGFIPDSCETGVPSYTGYSLITNISGLINTTYLDDNNGAGLIHGVEYCYMVIARYPDGAESYASVEFCAKLIKDVPVITHVSVGVTDINSGVDTVIWSVPTELDDSIQYPGPYHYKIYSSADFTSAGTLIGSTPTNSVLELTDTFFVDKIMLNTKDTPHSYKIKLYSGSDLVGPTHVASSVFLSASPSDNQLELTWEENVPWTNTEYVVYKFNDSSSSFEILDTVNTQSFIVTGLDNAKEYCFYVKSIGAYSSAGLINPIINFSQELCAVPVDTTPPCAPTLSLIPDCENIENFLIWNNPNNSCADDVVQYNIYYTPVLGGDLEFIQTVYNASDTTLHWTPIGISSIAGCYAITAVDSLITYSFGTIQNESALSDTVCVDNCPFYELPNVFSPDGNYKNDKFIPFPYMYVESIDIKIFNRWGQLMFKTTDPDINWDGKNRRNNEDCTEGVYFYICKVNAIRLEGTQTFVLKGFVHLLRGEYPDTE
ncbi:MAG: gliding motility-associated C-terminal domain-containing protein [Bacteroidota bacterium]